MNSAGSPRFAVHPLGTRATYNVLTYVEPMQGFETTFGLDIASNARVAKTLADSRDSGKLMTSGRLITVGRKSHQVMSLGVKLL